MSAPPVPDHVRAADTEMIPASSTQRGMWLSHQLDSTGTAYRVVRILDMAGPVDHDRLAAAVAATVRRHDALRTSFDLVGRDLFQVIHPDTGFRLATAADLEAPFDLGSPTLFRVRLEALADDHHQLRMTAHHLICDGPSLDIVWRDVVRAYRGEPMPPADDQPQFADYAAWESEWLGRGEHAGHLAYFRQALAVAPPAIRLPPAGGDADPATGTVLTRHLEAGVSRGLEDLARLLRVTVFTLMATLYGAVLHRWTGDPAIVIGTPASLREDDDLGATVGVLLNSVPVVTRWADNPTFADAGRAVRDAASAALRWRAYPFDRLIEDLRPARADGRSPVFQVFFTLVPAPAPPPSLTSAPIRDLPPPAQPAKFELSLDITVGDRMRCDLQWDPRRFSPAAAAAFLRHLCLAAERVTVDPDERIGDWLLTDPPDTDRTGADPARVVAPFFPSGAVAS